MNIKKIILIAYYIFILYQDSTLSSMFPNAYQYTISKTELKTRMANQYNMTFVDAQLFGAIEEPEKQDVIICAVWQGAYSFDKKNNFACSFSINKKDIILIAGDNITNKTASRDIRAEYIGGTGDTDADMELRAKQDLNSAKIFVQFPLEKMTGLCYLHNWFVSIRTSITSLTQQLSLLLTGTPESTIPHIYNFFANVTPYAKIDNRKRNTTGVDNITITLDGVYCNKNKTLQIYYYSGLEFPTEFTYSTPYLFYPFVGNNGNLGIMLGVDFRSYLYSNNMHEVGFLCEFENHYLTYKTMDRVFDLFQQNDQYFSVNAVNDINKPWSRYLPAYNFDHPQETALPVSMVSNLPVRVHECNNCDLSLGLLYHYRRCKNNSDYYISLGYNLWMSQPEYIELQDRVFPLPYQRFYNHGIAGSQPQTTSSQSTIKTQLENDKNATHFTITDLDYGSAVSDGSYSQGGFLRVTILQENNWNVLLGSWFEIGKYKMAPSRYGFWAGLGYQF